MNGNFVNEINALNREIKALKINAQKMASLLKTTSVVVPVEFTLSGSPLRSSQTAIITLTPYGGSIPLISNTIDILDLDQRSFWYVGGRQPDGTFKYEFYISGSNNSSDYSGKEINYNLVFISTSQIDNVDVKYEDN